MSTKEVTQLRKNGQLQEALEMALQDFENNENKYTHGSLFWVYRELFNRSLNSNHQEEAEGYLQKMLEHAVEKENALLTESLGWCLYFFLRLPNLSFELFSKFLNEYLGITNPRPSRLHSAMLGLVSSLLEKYPDFKFTDFLVKWNPTYFTDEDWARGRTQDGKELPSLVERCITRYMHELEQMSTLPDEHHSFEKLLRAAIKKYPEQDLHLRRLAQFMLLDNRKEEALSIYRKLLLSMKRFYVWHELAQLTEDIALKESALCMALTSGEKDDYLGELHLDLAELLIEKGEKEAAENELAKYNETYTKRGWSKKNRYYLLTTKLGKNLPERHGDNRDYYESHKEAAETFIYAEIPDTLMAVTSVWDMEHNGKKQYRAKLMSRDGVTILTGLKRLNVKAKEAKGRVYAVKLFQKEGTDSWSTVAIKPSTAALAEVIPAKLAVIDHVNPAKKLVHYVTGVNKGGIIHFHETNLRLNEGDMIEVYSLRRQNKEGIMVDSLVTVQLTEKQDPRLKKEVSGKLRTNIDVKGEEFGFVGDYFVPPHILKKSEAVEGDQVQASVLLAGERWRTYKLVKI